LLKKRRDFADGEEWYEETRLRDLWLTFLYKIAMNLYPRIRIRSKKVLEPDHCLNMVLQMAKNGMKMLTDLRDLWWIWAPGCQLVGKPERTAMSK
jgi:hypothetical protein